MNKDRRITIRINEDQYRYLSDKGRVSKVVSDIIDRDMEEMSDKDILAKTPSIHYREVEEKLKEDAPPEKNNIVVDTQGRNMVNVGGMMVEVKIAEARERMRGR